MRRSKEIVILCVLWFAVAGFVLWYVVHRRAQNRAETNPPPAVPAIK